MKNSDVIQQNKLILLLSLLIISFQGKAQESVELKFNSDKTFKIAQFTDIHWDAKSEKRFETKEIIENVLQKEKPDFVVLTGDIVTGEPIKKGWKEVTSPIIAAQIPWTMLMGNHDGEYSFSNTELFSFLKDFPNFIGEEGDVCGVGNFSLPVYSSKNNKIGAVLYFLDSHALSPNLKYGKYDWIKFDQVDWYRKTSDKYTAENNGLEIPSLAFFHIALPEFKLIDETTRITGEKYESVKSSEINSGLFASMVEKKDVFGVFVGHDHEISFIGEVNDICLSYGQVTGVDAVDHSITRGGRIIKIYDRKFALESWVRTPDKDENQFHFYYPEHLNKIEMAPLPAVEVKNPVAGLKYKYYEGEVQSCNDLQNLPLKKTGITENISIKLAEIKDYFGFEFEGYINIPETDLYNFYTYSDDGSMLYIDGQLVVDNDGSHSARRESGSGISLEKGLHKFKLLYFESYSGSSVNVGISSLKFRETIIPKDLFYTEAEE